MCNRAVHVYDLTTDDDEKVKIETPNEPKPIVIGVPKKIIDVLSGDMLFEITEVFNSFLDNLQDLICSMFMIVSPIYRVVDVFIQRPM